MPYCYKLVCYMLNAEFAMPFAEFAMAIAEVAMPLADFAMPGCADLFTGDAAEIAVGVILVLLLPLAFLLGSGIFIWRYLYHPRAPQRRAAFILMQDPDEPMVGLSTPQCC